MEPQIINNIEQITLEENQDGIVNTLDSLKIVAPEFAKKLEKFIELDKKKAEVKKFFDDYEEIVREIESEACIGFNFQDSEGTVYMLDTMEWKSVRITPFEIKRTRREGEAKGTLSLTKARELGYEVEGR